MRDLLIQLARQLHNAGMQHCFGITGSGPTWTLISELERLGIIYHPVSHEGAGAIMAGGCIQSTGRLSASLSIKGPGLANMAAGVCYNNFENLPALSMSETYDLRIPPFRMHKRMNHGSFIGQVAKGVASLADVGDDFGRILSSSHEEVPGPFHLELCADPTPRDTPSAPSGGAGTNWPEVLHRIQSAQRPIVIVGSLAKRRAWKSRLSGLRVPVFTTVAAKGTLDEASPYSAGVFTGDGMEIAPESLLLAKADIIIGLGLRNLEVVKPRQLQAPLVLLDQAPIRVTDGFHADLCTPNAPNDAFISAFDSLEQFDWGCDEIAATKTRMRKALLESGWLPARCFQALEALPNDHALILDTGSFATIGEHIWQASPTRPYIGSSNGRFMGGSIPVAVGYSLGAPRVPVFCAVGDGGVAMYTSELRIAVQHRLPLCCIFMSDGRYGSIACTSSEEQFSRSAITFHKQPWLAVAEAMRVPSYRANNIVAFQDVVAGWDMTGPIFIECPFDPDSYRTMTKQLR